MTLIQSEPTPNPNSLKFTTTEGHFLEEGMAAFSSKEEADNHPLGQELFAIKNVADVFITPTFVTVSKVPSADWRSLKSEVETTLSEYLQSQ